MSTSAPAVIPSASTPNPQFLALQENFAKLDAFAAENSLEMIIGDSDKGAFTAQLRLATATVQRREMLTPEVMKPIMALQGSALGFRTDKDSSGGYQVETVREVLIEATMKGFRLLGNETNVIGGRFYAARDGFERIFRDLSKQGKLTELRMMPGIPKTTGDGVIVEYGASWTFKGIKDEMKRQGLHLSEYDKVRKEFHHRGWRMRGGKGNRRPDLDWADMIEIIRLIKRMLDGEN